MVTHILDQINVDKNAYNWVYSLVKYGDLYLRMLKDSEYNYQVKDTTDKLNEDIILKTYNKNDHYAMYLEETKNPAEVFDLQKYGKSICYIRAHIQAKANNPDDLLYQNALLYQYNFKRGDLDIFPATSYVHASLENTSSRTEEQVVISRDGDDSAMSYGVKRGQSVLYSAFKIWRELSLLENSVLLNRITRSAVIRVISIEGGDMEDREKRNTVQRFKQMIEQKSSINLDNSITNYTNPGPMENTMYTITHDGKGAITTSQIGGDVTPDQLTDLDYFKKKLYGALGIPAQFLGQTDDATGFNGGTSLSIISSQYAKTIKRVQNSFIQAITDAVNLILLDRGLTSYINKFTIHMQPPTTQEEKDRRESISSEVSNIQNIMSLIGDAGVEDPATKLKILTSLLSGCISNPGVITALQEQIDIFEEEGSEEDTGDEDAGEDMDMGGDFDLGGALGGDFRGDLGGEDLGSEEPLPTPEEAGVPTEAEAPEENFYNGTGELLNEEDEYNLPSFEELGINFNDVK